ncbi:MAG TPA: MFS transporter [Jatrophihabitantaceae bacterium]|nr:MFS transporter [Jatrophihabitantaceae bacterium]
MSAATAQTGTIETSIPGRLDRLPWARFHWLIILGLGTAWVLDGLEVTIVGAVASRLTESGSGVGLTAGDIGTAAAIYVVGSCVGALFFGQLTDRFGRKKLFMLTLALYIVATALTAASFTPWFFYLMRFFTGAGIGGEYAAINSAIDELIPARARGRIDLIINGSYWVGSMAGSGAALFFLDTNILPKNLGWRLAFLLGVVLAIAVMAVRRGVPESPRWLFIHGQEDEAERLVDGIEHDIEEQTGQQLPEVTKTLTVRQRTTIPFREIARVAVKVYPRRSILCLALFVGQAFIYNGITFNLGTLMTTFFGVASGAVPIFTIVYAASNFTGPLILGRLFDTIGRKPMISGTYLGSAAIAVLLGVLFTATGLLGAWTFIVIVMATFFLASAGASAAYLTASEIFPMETRALAIAFFYAIGTGVGGIAGPLLFGHLIGSKSDTLVAVAFFIGAGVMALGGIAELAFGVKAEGAQLEDIAKPLTVEDAEQGGTERGDASGTSEQAPDRRGGPAAEARGRAAEQRARAAKHRASSHQQLAAGGGDDPQVADRVETEERLAQAADTAAQAYDEFASAAEQRSAADAESDAHNARAARLRAEAAEQRAHAHEHEAAALTAATAEDADRSTAAAAAALDRSRALEQRAFAEQSRGRVEDADDQSAAIGNAQATMHEAWAAMHDHLAAAHELEAAGDASSAEAERARARSFEESARAASYDVEAAEHRAEAAGELAAGRDMHQRGEQDVDRERAELDAQDERIRSRLQRRRQREGTGLRRYRPGPGPVGRSPAITARAPLPEEALDSEIQAIWRALDEHGPTERGELARLVGARYWGPGVFRTALRIATTDGVVRRTSRTTYAAAEQQS